MVSRTLPYFVFRPIRPLVYTDTPSVRPPRLSLGVRSQTSFQSGLKRVFLEAAPPLQFRSDSAATALSRHVARDDLPRVGIASELGLAESEGVPACAPHVK